MLNKLKFTINSCFAFWLLKTLDLLGWSPSSGKIRANILRFFGFNIGKNAFIASGLRIFSIRDHVSIGKNTFINQNVFFDAPLPISIGKYCDIGFNTIFTTSQHNLKSNLSSLRELITADPIIVEDFVWIGANATVLSGVRIGEGAVVGAGSVVTKNVPPATVVVGNPAKVVKEL